MFQNGRRANLMRGLPRAGRDFQDLSECAKRSSGHLGRVIRTSVGDNHDP
jgi:hypothetical protein